MAERNAPRFPFSAVVGQDDLKIALLINAVDPRVGGVLVRGQRGTAKSTTVRALAALLPPLDVVAGCPYRCDPEAPSSWCPVCSAEHAEHARDVRPAPFVDLPLSATEDRVIGALDLERVLATGVRAFQPGLLAEANRGVLYVDEVNLLDDHLVDTLLDVAAAGENVVEREGVSVGHPARFVLVGTMNPEEGEVRPQLLDRFGLAVDVIGLADPAQRVEIVKRRAAFDADPSAFISLWQPAEDELRARIACARATVADVGLADELLHDIARLAIEAGVDGHRADSVIARSAKALAALDGAGQVEVEHVVRVAPMALGHRMRANPLQPTVETSLVARDVTRRVLGTGGAATDMDTPSSEGAAQGLGDAGVSVRMLESEGDAPAARASDASGTVPSAAEPLTRRLENTRSGRTTTTETRQSRGRFVRSEAVAPTSAGEVALEASVRAAALRQGGANADELAVSVKAEDLRRAVRSRRTGATIVFAVDASGSMGAASRMESAKEAVLELLAEAYRRRDRVGLVTFRGDGAETLLAPTASVELANVRLRHVATGGATPLAAGMLTALEVLRAEQRRDPDTVPWLVLVTDGRANVGLEGGVGSEDARSAAARVRVSGVRAMLLDTARGGSPAAREIAELSGASYELLGEGIGLAARVGKAVDGEV